MLFVYRGWHYTLALIYIIYCIYVHYYDYVWSVPYVYIVCTHGCDTLSFSLLTILYNVYSSAYNGWDGSPFFVIQLPLCNRSMQCAYISCDSDGVYLWPIVFAAMITSKRAPAILIRAYDGIFSQIPQSHATGMFIH